MSRPRGFCVGRGTWEYSPSVFALDTPRRSGVSELGVVPLMCALPSCPSFPSTLDRPGERGTFGGVRMGYDAVAPSSPLRSDVLSLMSSSRCKRTVRVMVRSLPSRGRVGPGSEVEGSKFYPRFSKIVYKTFSEVCGPQRHRRRGDGTLRVSVYSDRGSSFLPHF